VELYSKTVACQFVELMSGGDVEKWSIPSKLDVDEEEESCFEISVGLTIDDGTKIST